MHQKLLRNVVLIGIALVTAALIVPGCIDEPTIPPIGKMMTSVRFVHAVPDGQAVDIYIDNDKKVTGIAFKGSTSYLEIPSGDRVLKVTPAGGSTELFSKKIALTSLTQQSIVLYDASATMLALQTIERYTYSDETKILKDSNWTAIKLINVCTGSSPLQVRLDAANGTVVIPGPIDQTSKLPTTAGIAYGRPSPYSTPPLPTIAPGTYNMFFVAAATGQEFTTRPSVECKKGERYSMFLVGSSTSPEVVVLKDDQ